MSWARQDTYASTRRFSSRRSGLRPATDIADIEQYDTRTIGQLLLAVGDGAGGIPLSVAELIAERDLERLCELGYVGSTAVTAGAPSTTFGGPGLTAVNSPVVSVQSSVMSDNRPVLTSQVHTSVERDRDASVPAVTTGPQMVHMPGHFGRFRIASWMRAINVRLLLRLVVIFLRRLRW